MRKQPKMDTWVVYLMTLHGKPDGMPAVCEQSEWDALELERPGYHKLLKKGILTEMEAEQVAREHHAGNAPPVAKRKRS